MQLERFIIIDISVILPVYNEKLTYLRSSISSILSQTFSNFELIVVDDNPDSYKIKEYLKNISRNNSRVRVFFNKINKGTVFSANRAIHYAQGKYIARMDADDISISNRLENQFRFCNKYNLDFLSSNYFNMTGNIISKNSVYSDTTQLNQSKIKRTMSYINIATGSTLFFKRDISNNIGNYRDILDEDYDLAARFAIYGYKLGYLSTPVMYKRYRRNSLSGKHSLEEFVILKLISDYLRKYKFTKVVPVSIIKKDVSNIKTRDYIDFHKFILSSLRYKQHKSFKNNLNRYIWACSSPLIFKRNIFTILYKFIQNTLLN